MRNQKRKPVISRDAGISTPAVSSNIDVRLGCKATVENVKATAPDAVIAATGSYLFVPDFLGAIGDDVVTIEQLYDRKLNGDEKIVVLGRGVNGSEVAMYLAQDGHKVTVVEMTSDFSANLGIMNRFSIVSELNKNENITLCPNTKSKYIDGNVLVCEKTYAISILMRTGKTASSLIENWIES